MMCILMSMCTPVHVSAIPASRCFLNLPPRGQQELTDAWSLMGFLMTLLLVALQVSLVYSICGFGKDRGQACKLFPIGQWHWQMFSGFFVKQNHWELFPALECINSNGVLFSLSAVLSIGTTIFYCASFFSEIDQDLERTKHFAINFLHMTTSCDCSFTSTVIGP